MNKQKQFYLDEFDRYDSMPFKVALGIMEETDALGGSDLATQFKTQFAGKSKIKYGEYMDFCGGRASEVSDSIYAKWNWMEAGWGVSFESQESYNFEDYYDDCRAIGMGEAWDNEWEKVAYGMFLEDNMQYDCNREGFDQPRIFKLLEKEYSQFDFQIVLEEYFQSYHTMLERFKELYTEHFNDPDLKVTHEHGTHHKFNIGVIDYYEFGTSEGTLIMSVTLESIELK